MTVLIGDRKVRIPKVKLLTYDDYFKLTPPDSGNFELHNGQIIYMPTPIPLHQKISGKLHFSLFGHIMTNGLGELFAAPMDTKLTENDTVQPDLLFISKSRIDIIGDKKIEGAPDFVVEILSPGNKDKEMSYKKYLYESCGVLEYWVVYPLRGTIKKYENHDNELILIGEFGVADTIKSSAIKGFSLKVKDVF